MGDDNTTRTKEFIPPTIQCPMLSTINYTVWSIKMKIFLKVHEVWDTIEPGTDDSDKNNIAIALLFQAIPDSLIMQVGEQDTPKKIWDEIKSRNLVSDSVKEARLQTLMSEFERIKMKDSETIDSFAGKLSELVSKSASLGQVIEESELVRKFLNSVPRNKFIQIIAVLEQVIDLKTTGFEDIVGRLMVYEERFKDEDSNGETKGNANSHQQGFTSSRGRGRSRGGHRYRGRGR